MFGKKCHNCNKKIKNDFIYCPYCAIPLKKKRKEDFGMLGENDSISENQVSEEIKLPFGMDKMMNSLVKQLDKELSANGGFGGNKGFKIQISTGMPQMKKVQQKEKKPTVQEYKEIVEEKEETRRKILERESAKANVRRLSDKLVYEIDVPGVKLKKDIIITKLENSIEVKAYSKDKCYYKSIPLTVEIIGFYLKDEKLFLELKS